MEINLDIDADIMKRICNIKTKIADDEIGEAVAPPLEVISMTQGNEYEQKNMYYS